MKELVIGKNEAGQRLDRFLLKRFPALPAASLQKWIRLGRVKRNGKKADRSLHIEEGDILSIYINDEYLAQPDEDKAYLFVRDPALTVVYEDDNILLLDKPAGLLCHPDEREKVNTLLTRMQAYLYQKGDYLPETTFAPSLCNRIDRNTRGIVIAAKNAEALRIMDEKIRLREVEKYYHCLVKGIPKPSVGALEGFILRDMDKKQVYVYSEPRPGARTAKTVYRVLERRGDISLLECRLMTGRTHQIRAQMAAAGWPLVGDGKYGILKDGERAGQELCSCRIVFAWKDDAGILEYLRDKSFEIDSGF